MQTGLQIHLFNNFQLTYNGKSITTLKGAPAQSLLAYLLLHRDGTQSRQQVAYLLWPESTEAQARTNLRRELHNVRHALPDADTYLTIDNRSLRWNLDSPFTLDVAHFETAIAQVDQLTATGATAALQDALEQAVELYTGDLLPACYNDWIASERERLAQTFIYTLEALIQLLEQQRDYAAAIRHAQRLRRYDPLYEASYRHLMRLLALNGERAEALRVYHTCVTLLRRELNVGPSPATQAIYAQLMKIKYAPREQHAGTALVTPNALIGRRTEWEKAQVAWQRTAHTDSPRHVHFLLITGDAGIGKTRFLEELLEWADRQGIATAQSRCYAAGGQIAYTSMAEWLRTDALYSTVLDLDEVWLTEIARLLPEILVKRPDLLRPGPLGEGSRRLRLFRALAQVMMADHQPLLLAIDDLQWCDHESLEWLHYFLRCTSPRRLLVVGTLRATMFTTADPLYALILDLRHTDHITEVELGPLSAEATAELAAQTAGRAIDPNQAGQLHAETEGYPLFIVEMVRAQDALAQDTQDQTNLLIPGPDEIDPHQFGSVALPPKVYALLQARLSQLSPQARKLVELAATIGRSFKYAVLAQADEADEESLVHGLDELWQQNIIREQGRDAYDFSHDKIREVAYSEISRTRQQYLHGRVAHALSAVYAHDLDHFSGQIATHYEQAGMFELAMVYYRRAAETARRVYANQEAKELYTRAITASRMVPAPKAGELLHVYEGRGRVYRSLSQLEGAVADFQVMRQLAQAAQEWQMEGESLCQLAYTHWLTFNANQMAFVEQYAQEAVACAAQTGDSSLRARSLTMLGAVDQVHRRMSAARQKLDEALRVSRDAEDKEALVQVLSFLCLQTYLQADARATVQLAEEGAMLARAIQDDFNELRIQAFRCQGEWTGGNYARADRLLQETMAQADERGNTFVRGRLLNTLGWFHHEFCDFSGALAFNQQSIELGRMSGIANVEISALINLGNDYLALGQMQAALDCFTSTLARVEEEGFGAHKWRWQMKLMIGLAEHAYAAGAYAEALRRVASGLVEAQTTGSLKYVAKAHALRGKILQQLGQTAAAGNDLQRAFEIGQSLHSPALTYPLAHALGEWYEATDQRHAAATCYRTAKAAIDQMTANAGSKALADGFLQAGPIRLLTENWARTL